MRNHRSFMLLAAVLATLAGCATSPRIDRQFGDSLRLAKVQQTMYPDAGRERRAVTGLDATAAQSAYDSYQRSFASPEQSSNSLTIGVGGSSQR